MVGGERDQSNSSGGYRYLGLGMELAAAVAGLTLVGVWVDRHFETSPWGVLIGTGTGLVGGLYNVVKAVITGSGQADSGSTGSGYGAGPTEGEKPKHEGPEDDAPTSGDGRR